MKKSRDQHLAETKYAGRKSASQEAAEKSKGASRSEVKDAMRAAIAAPRTQDSIERARRHRDSLPPLG